MQDVSKSGNLTRRRVLRAGAAAAITTVAGCNSIKPLLEIASTVVATPEFDAKKAGENLSVAVLPLIYEQEHILGSKSHDDAIAIIRNRLPEQAEFTIIRHENTTAVVVYDPNKGRITVAYDASMEARDMLNNWDYESRKHSMGAVHTGYLNSIESKDNKNVRLCDRVKAQVEQYAAKQGEKIDVTLTGFSRGGALAMATAAEWLVQGMQKNTHLTHVQTFGSPPFGDQEFVNNFMHECNKLGTNVERVIAGNDITHRNMTGEISGQRKRYSHAGKAIYLMPRKEEKITDVLVNPTSEILRERSAKLQDVYWHDTDTYASLLGAREAYTNYSRSSLRAVAGPVGHQVALAKREAAQGGNRERC